MLYNLIKTILCSILFLNYSFAYQERNQKIIDGAKNFIIQQITAKYKTVDPKTIHIKILNNNIIQNKYCSKPIIFYFPIYSNINKKSTIIAECQDKEPNNWKIYIPVNIKFLANAIFTKKTLPKHHIICKEDLVRQKINVLQIKDHYYTDPNDIVGLTLQLPVKSNTVLTATLFNFKEVSYDS